MVDFDAHYLSEVVDNLLSNANKIVLNPRAAPPLSSSLLRRSGYAKAQLALAEALDSFFRSSASAEQLLASPKRLREGTVNARGSCGEFDQTSRPPSACRRSFSGGTSGTRRWIKYSYNNSEIKVKISLPDDKQILMEVIDKGKGIPAEEQKVLFNYFQKTSTQPTGGETSTRLGLAIVKRIILLYCGEVGADSILDKGSNFHYLLPINQ